MAGQEIKELLQELQPELGEVLAFLKLKMQWELREARGDFGDSPLLRRYTDVVEAIPQLLTACEAADAYLGGHWSDGEKLPDDPEERKRALKLVRDALWDASDKSR